MKSLVSINDLTLDEVYSIFEDASSFKSMAKRENKKFPTLKGRTVVNLFLEPSTRTATSFELAAKRLSADVVNFKGSGSSLEKGESFKDTILTLNSYDPHLFVIRSKSVGAPLLAQKYTDAVIVNAGDGAREHPTQALLDVFTMREIYGRIRKLKVVFVGDALHSRVVRSTKTLLEQMGAKVYFCGPPSLIPPGWQQLEMKETNYADVVYPLRMQFERMTGSYVPSVNEYIRHWQVNREWWKSQPLIEPTVFHAGPMNRGIEISDELADSPAILQQAENGLFVRMAVLRKLLSP